MKKNILKGGVFALALGMVFTACQTEEMQPNLIDSHQGQLIDGSYIVVYNDDAKGTLTGARYADRQDAMMSQAQEFIAANAINGTVKRVYSEALVGFTIDGISRAEAEAISMQPNVKYVEQNRVVTLAPPCGTPAGGPCDGGGGGGSEGQTVPYGTPRVNGGVTYTGSNVAWIIDTGIDLDHEDLNVDATRSVDFTGQGPDDGNGHGTHCAGTVAAIDNTIGSLGVAAGATVIGVKVLDNRGSGSYADVIAGIDHVAANGSAGDVANLSLGGGFSQTVNDAVINLGQAGVYTAVAAGNSGADANGYSPASANGVNVYTISAVDSNDNFASFSNWGNPPVDYAAPGVSVYSTYSGNSYNTLSGTSMASPHAAGVLLLTGGNPNSNGTANNDPDGNPDPIIYN